MSRFAHICATGAVLTAMLPGMARADTVMPCGPNCWTVVPAPTSDQYAGAPSERFVVPPLPPLEPQQLPIEMPPMPRSTGSPLPALPPVPPPSGW